VRHAARAEQRHLARAFAVERELVGGVDADRGGPAVPEQSEILEDAALEDERVELARAVDDRVADEVARAVDPVRHRVVER
jgi:hypothetical protein